MVAKIKHNFISLICIFCTSCDTFKDPIFLNNYGRPVKILLTKDGQKVSESFWPDCSYAYIGGRDSQSIWLNGKLLSGDKISLYSEDTFLDSMELNQIYLSKSKLSASGNSAEFLVYLSINEGGVLEIISSKASSAQQCQTKKVK